MTDLPPMTPPETPPVSARASGRWLRVALAVSLALNLAVIGTVLGLALRGHESGRSAAIAVRDLSFGPFTEALTRDQRRSLLREFAANGPGLREIRRQIRGDFEAVLATLRAQPFDETRFRALVQTQNARMSERTAAGQEALIALVAHMSDTERAAFVDRLEKSLSRRGGRDHDDDDHDRRGQGSEGKGSGDSGRPASD